MNDYSKIPTSQLDQLIKTFQSKGVQAPNINDVTPEQLAAKSAQESRLGDSQGSISAYDPSLKERFLNSDLGQGLLQTAIGALKPSGVDIKATGDVGFYNPFKQQPVDVQDSNRTDSFLPARAVGDVASWTLAAAPKAGVSLLSKIPGLASVSDKLGKAYAVGPDALRALAASKLAAESGKAAEIVPSAVDGVAKLAQGAARGRQAINTGVAVSSPIGGPITNAYDSVKAELANKKLEPPTGSGQLDASGNTVPNANGDMSTDSPATTKQPTEIVKSEAGVTGAGAQDQIKKQSNEAGQAISDIFNKRKPITNPNHHTVENNNRINKMSNWANPHQAALRKQELTHNDYMNNLLDMQGQLLQRDHLDPEEKAQLDLITNTLKEQSTIRVAQAQKHAQGALSPSQRAAEMNPSAVKNFSAVMNNDEPADFDTQQLKTLASMKDLMALFRDPITGQVDFSRMIGPNAGQQNRQLNSPVKQQPAKKK